MKPEAMLIEKGEIDVVSEGGQERKISTFH
jgi:hypothetical protein